MKVVYLSDYSKNAINNMLSIDAVGINLASRQILSNQQNTEVEKFEYNDLKNIDIIIQDIPPIYFQYKNGIKNIGCVSQHTTNGNWVECCNIMDEIWVTSEHDKSLLYEIGIKKPIKVVVQGCNIEKYKIDIEPFQVSELKDKFIFYTIANLDRINNIPSLIRTFYATFTRHDNVVLLMKTSSQSTIKKLIDEIKKAINIQKDPAKYPPIFVITEELNETDINRLHILGHAFVLPAHDSSWCHEAQDAMGFGNPIIVSHYGSFIDLIGDSSGSYFVNGHETFCFGTEKEIHNGKQKWFEPNLVHLSSIMQDLYSQNQVSDKVKQINKKRISNFSYKNVGEIIKCHLL